MHKLLDIMRFQDDGIATRGIGRMYDGFGSPELDDLHSIERPWLDNAPNISCISVGQYLMKLGMYNNGGYPAYEVLGVEDRTLIKIHIGNWAHDLEGCIALGLRGGILDGLPAVMGARIAYGKFMGWAGGDDYMQLRIRDFS